MLPIYGALHFIPAIAFRRKGFTQDPGKVLFKATLGSLRSSAFLGVFVVICQSEFNSPMIGVNDLISPFLFSSVLW